MVRLADYNEDDISGELMSVHAVAAAYMMFAIPRVKARTRLPILACP